jgi:hypothetical protein
VPYELYIVDALKLISLLTLDPARTKSLMSREERILLAVQDVVAP